MFLFFTVEQVLAALSAELIVGILFISIALFLITTSRNLIRIIETKYLNRWSSKAKYRVIAFGVIIIEFLMTLGIVLCSAWRFVDVYLIMSLICFSLMFLPSRSQNAFEADIPIYVEEEPSRFSMTPDKLGTLIFVGMGLSSALI